MQLICNFCSLSHKGQKAWNKGKPKPAEDGLALFLVNEFRETFDPSLNDRDQLREAQRVIHNAAAELERLLDGIEIQIPKAPNG